MAEPAQQKLTEVESLRLQLAATDRKLRGYEHRLLTTIGIVLGLDVACIIGVRLMVASNLAPDSVASATALGYIATALMIGGFAFLVALILVTQMYDGIPAYIRVAAWLLAVALAARVAHATFYQFVLPAVST